MNKKRFPIQPLEDKCCGVDKTTDQVGKFPIVKRQIFLVVLCLVLLALCPLTAFGSPSILMQHDEDVVLAVLVGEIPDLTVNTVTLISDGWDNLVADINGEWIFRFPRSEEFMPILEREQLLLERLQKSVSMQVPYYQFIGMQTAFVGYRKILGEALHEKLYLNLTVEGRQKIAESLALFLSQFHNAISVNEALQWGYKEYHLPLHWIEHDLIGTLPSSAIERIVGEALSYYKHNPFSEENLVLLHNDLHGENLVFDINTEQITGVFDFSDAVIGDYSVEFGKLFSIHQDLAIRTSEAYADLNNISNPAIPGAVDYILRRALYILYARESGDTSREQSLLQMLQRFVPIWDDLQIESKRLSID